MKFRKKPVEVRAYQWFKNGDHPLDGHPDNEGKIVRYYRHPSGDGQHTCNHCGRIMHDHGWIDTLEGGHTVCPGDWVITGIKGEVYPCKPDVFEVTYEKVEEECDQPKRLSPEDLEHHLATIAAYFIPRNDGFESTARVSAHIRALEQEMAEAWKCYNTILNDGYKVVLEERDSARAEVERLKAELATESSQWDEQHARQHAINVRLEKERDEARAQAARLRGALERISSASDDPLGMGLLSSEQRIAREALKAEEGKA